MIVKHGFLLRLAVCPGCCEVKRYMGGSVRRKRLRFVTLDIAPLRSLVLVLFLTGGIACGFLASRRCLIHANDELRRYFEACLSQAEKREFSPVTVAQTLACYLRSTVLSFLFGFASIGVIVLPVLFFAQGFLLSFSLFSFAAALGRSGFPTLIALFGLRLLFVLPCALWMGAEAMDKAYAMSLLTLGGGKRLRAVSYGTAYWYRFVVCCVCLLLGCALELWLLPLFLTH